MYLVRIQKDTDQKNSIFGHSSYSVRIQKDTDQKKLRIRTLFHSVLIVIVKLELIVRTYRKEEEQPRFYFSKFLY